MEWENRYKNRKEVFLSDINICKENLDLFKKFFDFEEVKLKRKNDLRSLDESCYKTLYHFLSYFNNVNKWFNNKPWVELTREDIQKVFDDLEDGVIKKSNGKPFEDRVCYYNKVFRAKPFEMAGKRVIAKEVMEFYKPRANDKVNFITFDDFKKIQQVSDLLSHKCLLWLAWDIGENVGSLLKLQKKDFYIQVNKETKETEYRVNLRREILKRTRTSRCEVTNFKETVEYLNVIMEGLNEEDKLFKFGHRQAEMLFKKYAEKLNIKCIPTGNRPTFKDIRSSMACYLIKEGWTTDEVNKRLGHKPSSREIDKYVNFLSMDSHTPKKKLYFNDLQEVKEELEESKRREKLQVSRIQELTEGMDKLEQYLPILKAIESNKEVIGILSKELCKSEVFVSSDIKIPKRIIDN